MDKHIEGTPGHDQSTQERVVHFLYTNAITLVVLGVLSAVGIGVTDVSPRHGLWYWMAMAPIFGGANIYFAWSRTQKAGAKGSMLIWNQVIHWMGFLAAIFLVYLLNSTGRMNSADAGLVALLVLALATFLAGVHGDWRFYIMGVLLGAAVAGAAFLEEFLWMMLLPLMAAIIIAVIWFVRKKSSAPSGR